MDSTHLAKVTDSPLRSIGDAVPLLCRFRRTSRTCFCARRFQFLELSVDAMADEGFHEVEPGSQTVNAGPGHEHPTQKACREEG
jgi:hypothetical protein